jgi:hypothetical protein
VLGKPEGGRNPKKAAEEGRNDLSWQSQNFLVAELFIGESHPEYRGPGTSTSDHIPDLWLETYIYQYLKQTLRCDRALDIEKVYSRWSQRYIHGKDFPHHWALVFDTPSCAMYRGMSSSVWLMNFASSAVVLETMSIPLADRHIASYQDMSKRFGIKIASQSKRVLIKFCMSKG